MTLTGEPDDVKKYAAEFMTEFSSLTPPNEIFSSTTVTTGTATALVQFTGMQTRVGRIAELMKEAGGGTEKDCLGLQKKQKTPLQHKLHKLGLMISTGTGWRLLAPAAFMLCGVVALTEWFALFVCLQLRYHHARWCF